MSKKLVSKHVFSEDEGVALIITLMALSFFSLLGLFMLINASTGLEISDNSESQLQASYAALSGLNHGRALLRGVSFDDLLKGPDGVCDRSASYMSQAKTFNFRNLLSITAAQSLTVSDPSAAISGISDDGLINTGFYAGVHGVALIPLAGIALSAPNQSGIGTIVTSRYFVKVSDNNGNASEIAEDPDDDPFVDGDGIVTIRSMGVARTISDSTGMIRRNNSVAVFEARMRRSFAFDLGPALVIHGSQINPSFEKTWEISGGEFPGIGTIDPDPNDGFFPDRIIRTANLEDGIIEGGNLPNPSVKDISGQVASNSMKSLLLNPNYLGTLAHSTIPHAADNCYEGDQSWSDLNADLGSYDPAKPANAPDQDPKVVVVNGNLQLTGNVSGGGLLLVTGDLACSGPFRYSGLILVMGSGRLLVAGQAEITGSIYISNLNDENGQVEFGATAFSIGGGARIVSDKKAVRMALELLPPSQIGFREIAGSDP